MIKTKSDKIKIAAEIGSAALFSSKFKFKRAKAKVIFGRDATQCTYAITDAQVSRKHCEITYVGALNKYRVVDYSKNGTFLGNGARLEREKEYYLSSAEELYMGNEDNLYKLR